MSDSASETDEKNKDDDRHNGFFVSRDKAYKIGVLEAADHPVIFIDPNKVLKKTVSCDEECSDPQYCDSDIVRARTFEGQMERQVPESTKALLDKMEKEIGERPSLEKIAERMSDTDLAPAAINQRIVVDGQEYGVAITPPNDLNSKKEIVYEITKHLDNDIRREIYENTPGTNKDWMRFFGNHEGTHLEEDHSFSMTNLEILIEERRADQGAYDLTRERGQGDIVLAFKDLRSLAAHKDITHATTPLIDSNDQVTGITYNAASFFREQTIVDMRGNFDFSSHQANGGKATNPGELLKEDPEAYFAVAQKALDDLKNKVMEDYNADPTLLNNQRAVIAAQLTIDYQENFEDAYRRRALGQDIPERSGSTQLISQEAEDAYVANIDLHEKMIDIEFGLLPESFSDNEFSFGKIFENYDWESYPGEAKSVWDLASLERYGLELEFFEEKKAEVLEDFKNNPSLETYKRVFQLQNAMNEAASNINFDMEVEGSGEKPIEPEVLITEAEKQEFLIDQVKEQEKLAAIEVEIKDIRDAHETDVWSKMHEGEGVFESFDWENYEGTARTPVELWVEDREVFLQHVTPVLEDMKQEAQEAYQADPSYENTGRLLEVQYLIEDNMSSLRAAEQDGIMQLPPDFPEEAPVLVPEDAEVQYYRERKERLANEENVSQTQESTSESDIDYKKGVNGGAYTTEVKTEFNGQPVVSFGQEGSSIVTPNGKTMQEVFREVVSPDPDLVASVDAKAPDMPDVPVSPPVEVAMQNQI